MGSSGSHSTREAIVEAASRCLIRKGYASVSLRQIAREAGVALGQIHYYFPSKEGLFVEVMHRATRQHVREIVAWLSRLPAEERIGGLVRFVRAKLHEDPGWFQLLFDFSSLAFHDPEIHREMRRLFRDVADEATRAFAGFQAAASLPSAPPLLARLSPDARGLVFVATLYGLALLGLIESDESRAGAPVAWFDDLLRAVSPPESS